MRLSLLFSSLLLSTVTTVTANAVPDPLPDRTDTASPCGRAKLKTGPIELNSEGKCTDTDAGMISFVIDTKCLCKFYNHGGCKDSPSGGTRQGPTQGDLPRGIDSYACRFPR
ncbi:hypothetical protein K491DRAFT_715183 [Lophiostoma macrostomum CBS 122681]|uniref:Uncharacterized protein n=1 Tax=Lophiostoma macrostomum CBS 122681 TaxID=1314788 RepID=A0A6A6TAB7_9PLEO|nr:hypothetical protein K491DRAFT_715183 [Lophiostoma macrostomum CBS 122681]